MNVRSFPFNFSVVLAVGCSEDSVVGVVTVDPDSCIPNQNFSCPCVMEDGSPGFGVQTCNPDGVSYSGVHLLDCSDGNHPNQVRSRNRRM